MRRWRGRRRRWRWGSRMRRWRGRRPALEAGVSVETHCSTGIAWQKCWVSEAHSNVHVDDNQPPRVHGGAVSCTLPTRSTPPHPTVVLTPPSPMEEQNAKMACRVRTPHAHRPLVAAAVAADRGTRVWDAGLGRGSGTCSATGHAGQSGASARPFHARLSRLRRRRQTYLGGRGLAWRA